MDQSPEARHKGTPQQFDKIPPRRPRPRPRPSPGGDQATRTGARSRRRAVTKVFFWLTLIGLGLIATLHFRSKQGIVPMISKLVNMLSPPEVPTVPPEVTEQALKTLDDITTLQLKGQLRQGGDLLQTLEISLFPDTKSQARYHEVAGQQQMLQGQFRDSLSHYNKLMELYQQEQLKDDKALLALECKMGELYKTMGSSGKALQIYLDAYQKAKALYGEDHLLLAEILMELGTLKYVLGHPTERVYKRVGELYRQNFAEEDPRFIKYQLALAQQSLYNFKITEGKDIIERELERARTHHGESAQIYAWCLKEASWLYYSIKEPEKGEKYMQEAISVIRLSQGPDHPEYAKYLVAAVNSRLYKSSNPEAYEELLREAISAYQRNIGEHHFRLSNLMAALAKVEEANGRMDEAVKQLEDACALTKKSAGEEAPNLPPLLIALGRMYNNQGHYLEARDSLEKARDLLQYPMNLQYMTYIHLSETLGSTYLQLNMLGQAEASFRQAFELRQEYMTIDLNAAENFHGLAQVYSKKGDLAKAIDYYNKTINLLNTHADDALEKTVVLLGYIHFSIERSESAQPANLGNEGLPGLNELLDYINECTRIYNMWEIPTNDIRHHWLTHLEGIVLMKMDKLKEAEVKLGLSYAKIRTIRGEADPVYSLPALRRLIEVYEKAGKVEQAEPFREKLSALEPEKAAIQKQAQ